MNIHKENKFILTPIGNRISNSKNVPFFSGLVYTKLEVSERCTTQPLCVSILKINSPAKKLCSIFAGLYHLFIFSPLHPSEAGRSLTPLAV